jgi:dTDP-glucose 4,6-dehydratase
MIANALEDKSLPIYGDGLNVRDWIFVDDHARGIWKAFEHGEAGAVYNFGARNEQRNIDVVKAILAATGKSESLIAFVKDRPGHDRRYAIDPTLAESALSWKPATSWPEGLEITIDWYRSNPQWIANVRTGEYLDYYDRMYGER